jgi:tRNA threonylcarbamoyladenosine biosynthesis protein TsaB
MALIVSLETSATACSVALHENGELKNTLAVTESQAHAAKLAVLLKELTASVGGLRAVEAVAVSSGPGSYTGLRIGVSTAKGICYALNKPLLAIGTLDLLISQLQESNTDINKDDLLCPMVDARRMEVYYQIANGAGRIIHPIEAKVIDDSSFSELLKAHKMFFFGDGSAKCREVISHPNARFVNGYTPHASGMGKVAYQRFLKNEAEDLIHFVPFYLKDFIAKKAPSVF